jgi:hypothetical protein
MTFNKLYVIIRSDISPEQQAIQAGHAAVEWARKHGYRFPHPTFVFLGAKNELHLIWLMIRLILAGKSYTPFHEPDLADQVTAIAVHHIGESKLFKNLPLMKFKLQ